MNRCVPVVSAGSDLRQKRWSKAHNRAKGHVRSGRCRGHPQTRQATESSRIATDHRSFDRMGQKQSLSLPGRHFRNGRLSAPRAAPGLTAIDCVNAAARSLSARSGPVRKNCAARTGSSAGPVSNLMQSRQETGSQRRRESESRRGRRPGAGARRVGRGARQVGGVRGLIGRGARPDRRDARPDRRDARRVGGVTRRVGRRGGTATGTGAARAIPGLPTTLRSAVGTVMTLRIRTADPALPGLRFTA